MAEAEAVPEEADREGCDLQLGSEDRPCDLLNIPSLLNRMESRFSDSYLEVSPLCAASRPI